MAEPKQPKDQTASTNGLYQNYFVQDYGVTVKARSISEAISKAEKQSKEQK